MSHPADRFAEGMAAHFEHEQIELISLHPVLFRDTGLEGACLPSHAQGWTLSAHRGFFSLDKELPALADMRAALLALAAISERFEIPCSIACREIHNPGGSTPAALHAAMQDIEARRLDDLRAESQLVSRALGRCLSAHGRLGLIAEIGADPASWTFMDKPVQASYSLRREYSR